VSIETQGQKASRNTIIAEARLREIPPAHSSTESGDVVHLDWRGEVRCGHDISVGGFTASSIIVKVKWGQDTVNAELTLLDRYRTSLESE
jgi:hypothetical protein